MTIRPATPAGPDRSGDNNLSYLHPDRLRLGGVGVFAGDWAWTGTPPRIPVGFVGTFIDTWNGWAVFTCTREVAEAIVAEQERQRDEERVRLGYHFCGEELDAQVDEAMAPMWFDGDDLICDETAQQGEAGIERITADQHGRYVVKGYSWCWIAVDPADCDRIAGVIPPAGQHQEFVYLPHTDLRAPHNQLRVTSLSSLAGASLLEEHPDGGYPAVLRLGRRKVGTIKPGDNDGEVVFCPSGAAFGRTEMRQFVAACRWYGQSVTEAQVLGALMLEHAIGRQIAEAATGQMTLVRVRDTDRTFIAANWKTAKPARRSSFSRDQLTELTAAAAREHPGVHAFVWEYWNGHRWVHIDTITAHQQQTGDR